jgi:hypothetical protein
MSFAFLVTGLPSLIIWLIGTLAKAVAVNAVAVNGSVNF